MNKYKVLKLMTFLERLAPDGSLVINFLSGESVVAISFRGPLVVGNMGRWGVHKANAIGAYFVNKEEIWASLSIYGISPVKFAEQIENMALRYASEIHFNLTELSVLVGPEKLDEAITDHSSLMKDIDKILVTKQRESLDSDTLNLTPVSGKTVPFTRKK